MVGDDSISSQQSPPSEVEAKVVINVPFPYPLPAVDDDPVETAEPALKIDYTAIEIPMPKKTTVLRRNSQTRLVKMEKSLPKIQGELSSETTVDLAAKAEEISGGVEKVLKNVGTLSLAAQESQRQFAVITVALEKQAAALPKLDALQKHFDQSHKVETANQRLFDVMHGELKGYKDNFLFDALQKPVIRDMLALFDDLCGQARRIARFLRENTVEAAAAAELQASHDNINNTVFFIIEVLNRLDVTMLEGDDTVLDLKLHKVVGVEPTADPEAKNRIARVVRPGFVWKERSLRPTEVIIKKYTAATEDSAT